MMKKITTFISNRKFTFTLTSLALGGATSMVSMERGLPASQATAALHVIDWKK